MQLYQSYKSCLDQGLGSILIHNPCLDGVEDCYWYYQLMLVIFLPCTILKAITPQSVKVIFPQDMPALHIGLQVMASHRSYLLCDYRQFF